MAVLLGEPLGTMRLRGIKLVACLDVHDEEIARRHDEQMKLQ